MYVCVKSMQHVYYFHIDVSRVCHGCRGFITKRHMFYVGVSGPIGVSLDVSRVSLFHHQALHDLCGCLVLWLCRWICHGCRGFDTKRHEFRVGVSVAMDVSGVSRFFHQRHMIHMGVSIAMDVSLDVSRVLRFFHQASHDLCGCLWCYVSVIGCVKNVVVLTQNVTCFVWVSLLLWMCHGCRDFFTNVT